MKLKGAEVLMECLKEQGVDIIFGYPGGAVLPIYDALYKTEEITHILTAHEQGATHAADGYARSTGKVGVVIATSGPGATNTVTGIATAYLDSIPMVVFTGQVSKGLIGKDSFQEVNIVDITSSITKKNYIVTKSDELQSIIREAFKIAKEGRRGPVVIDIPKDIQVLHSEYDFEPIKASDVFPIEKENDFKYNEALIEAINAINASEKPVIYAGGGVISSEAQSELLAFAKKIDAPVTCSLMGLGGYSGVNDNYMGMVGMHGSKCSNFAVSKCDLLIAIGARFSDRVISKADDFAKNAKVIHIDIDAREFGKNIHAHIALNGDVKKVLNDLIEKVYSTENSEWIKQIATWKEMKTLGGGETSELSPKYIIETLSELTNGDCIITTEVGQNQMWAAQYFKYKNPRSFVSSCGLGTMGFGLGAAIGAKFGNPTKKVINIAGDGSFKMNSTELATVSKYRVPIIQLVLNNHALGMVHQWQDMFFEGRFSQTNQSTDVDFIKLAAAYGIKAFKITKNEDVLKILKEALSLNEPVLIECEINRGDKVFPIVPPGVAISELIG